MQRTINQKKSTSKGRKFLNLPATEISSLRHTQCHNSVNSRAGRTVDPVIATYLPSWQHDVHEDHSRIEEKCANIGQLTSCLSNKIQPKTLMYRISSAAPISIGSQDLGRFLALPGLADEFIKLTWPNSPPCPVQFRLL